MLQLRDVRKSYRTAGFTQRALDDITIGFRDNEFVAVLGPSGSGKTTLLNIVGGLDQADSGELTIDGVATSRYKSRDWDTYRNNRIGFVFQSYNLIPHQSVLANVELALTLAGVSRTERRRRAIDALTEVGLADHMHKRPNQLSGGQMQRVAIARALINDPEILLADEPTGALDSATGAQIMALLQGIAADRLVIMVTHNPELAQAYATRIVQLKDGHVATDTNPHHPEATAPAATKPRRTVMGFLTAMALSLSNLMTKKGRTTMTAFAGSIGIIGIAAIFALANGVNLYIKSVEEDTLAEYPLSIMAQSMDFASMLSASSDIRRAQSDPSSGKVQEIQTITRLFSDVHSNDLASLKTFLDNNGGGIRDHVQSIQYAYNLTPHIYRRSDDGIRQLNPDRTFAAIGLGTGAGASPLSSAMNTNVFTQLVDDLDLIEHQFELLDGTWPTRKDEVVVVLAPNGGLPDVVAYALGLRDHAELDDIVAQVANNEPVTDLPEAGEFTFDQIRAATFTVVNPADYFVHDAEFQVWTDRSDNPKFLRNLVRNGLDLNVSGIVQVADSSTPSGMSPGIYYTPELTRYLMEQSAATDVVQAQLDHPNINVFTGRTFAQEAAKPSRPDVDLSSLITVDPAALREAFILDASQLQLDPSQLDVELPSLAPSLDAAQLPALNLDDLADALQLDELITPADLTRLANRIDLTQLELPELDPSQLGLPSAADLAASLDPAEVAALTQQVTQTYLGWATAEGLDPADVATNFPAFIASDAAEPLQAEFGQLAASVLDQFPTQIPEAAQAALADVGAQLLDQLAQPFSKLLDKQLAQLGPRLQRSLNNYMTHAAEAVSDQLRDRLSTALSSQLRNVINTLAGQLPAALSQAININGPALADAFELDMEPDELRQLLVTLAGSPQSSLDSNLLKLGYADLDTPFRIDIFPRDFEAKSHIGDILADYNDAQEAAGEPEKVISYTDIVGALMSSVTEIIDIISYVLAAFVSIALLVSSIMIGVITYISVLERRKEIGILRAIGASKRDIRRVFNAETLLVGFLAGILGIAVTVLLTIPVNRFVDHKWGVDNVAVLPVDIAVILVATSMFLTFLAGLIPASAASRRDPVEALRAE